MEYDPYKIDKNVKRICKYMIRSGKSCHECTSEYPTNREGGYMYTISLPPKHWWQTYFTEYFINDRIAIMMIRTCKEMGYEMSYTTNTEWGYKFTLTRIIPGAV